MYNTKCINVPYTLLAKVFQKIMYQSIKCDNTSRTCIYLYYMPLTIKAFFIVMPGYL